VVGGEGLVRAKGRFFSPFQVKFFFRNFWGVQILWGGVLDDTITFHKYIWTVSRTPLRLTIFRFRGCLKKSSIINFLSHHLATSSPISFRIREISTKTRITLSHSSKSGQIRRQHATKCCTFPVLHRAAVIDSVSHNYSPSFPLSTSNFSVSHNYSPSFPLSTSNF